MSVENCPNSYIMVNCNWCLSPCHCNVESRSTENLSLYCRGYYLPDSRTSKLNSFVRIVRRCDLFKVCVDIN